MCIMMENWSWNYQLILRNEQKLSWVDRYLWTELREEIILNLYYFYFYTFTWNWYIKVCNYYSILPDLKLINFLWIWGCFPRKFVLNELVRSRVWIQPVFSSEFLSCLAILFASCFKVFGRLNDTASVASWACFTVYQCTYFLFDFEHVW